MVPPVECERDEDREIISDNMRSLLILAKGFFSFWVVADRGQPTWDYRPVKDVPGESPYAVYEPLPHPQHVKGQKGE